MATALARFCFSETSRKLFPQARTRGCDRPLPRAVPYASLQAGGLRLRRAGSLPRAPRALRAPPRCALLSQSQGGALAPALTRNRNRAWARPPRTDAAGYDKVSLREGRVASRGAGLAPDGYGWRSAAAQPRRRHRDAAQRYRGRIRANKGQKLHLLNFVLKSQLLLGLTSGHVSSIFRNPKSKLLEKKNCESGETRIFGGFSEERR